jgi:hypothetical protein
MSLLLCFTIGASSFPRPDRGCRRRLQGPAREGLRCSEALDRGRQRWRQSRYRERAQDA